MVGHLLVGQGAFSLILSFTITLKHTHTLTHSLGRTPLEEIPVRSRELYLTTHNSHKRQTFTPLAGIKPQYKQSSGPRPVLTPRGHWGRVIL